MDSSPQPEPQTAERRDRERQPASLPLQVRVETPELAGVCDNRSENGVFFTSGERLRVSVRLTEADGTSRVLAGHLVRVQRMSADSTGYAIELERE